MYKEREREKEQDREIERERETERQRDRERANAYITCPLCMYDITHTHVTHLLPVVYCALKRLRDPATPCG